MSNGTQIPGSEKYEVQSVSKLSAEGIMNRRKKQSDFADRFKGKI
jgi:hypothetical protein